MPLVRRTNSEIGAAGEAGAAREAGDAGDRKSVV